jgi:hypothetical protein
MRTFLSLPVVIERDMAQQNIWYESNDLFIKGNRLIFLYCIFLWKLNFFMKNSYKLKKNRQFFIDFIFI